MAQRLWFLPLLAALSALVSPLAHAQGRSSAGAASAAGPPRLVVFISIDQMRGDYITTYGSQWSRGLKWLAEGGALFMQAAYPYAYTVTCAGHATMSTGAFPMTHGMIGNDWYDRPSGRKTACTDDASVTAVSYGKPVPAGTTSNSARLLLAPTFSDELRAGALRPPRIVSLSMKPRSAIDLAGHQGDIVLWYSNAYGWQSSSAFGAAPHPVIERFLAANPMEKELARVWTKAMPESAYHFTDDGVAEFPFKGWTNQFPHPVTVSGDTQASERWEITPFADNYLARMAIFAQKELKLGESEGTDFLAISFSGLDRVGHGFGPRSHEVQDLLAQLDASIGQLLDALDARVGKGRYVLALTGDHGVSPVPEQLAAMGFDAGRAALGPAVQQIEALLSERYGARTDAGRAAPYVVAQAAGYLYFAPGVYERLRGDAETRQAVKGMLLRTTGIAQVIGREELESQTPTDDPVVRAARLNFRPDRSGDLFIVPKRYWQTGANGTTHGTPYKYDQRVPVLLYGAGVKPGRYWGAASPADIAPTLAAIVHVTMSRPDGRVLSEALLTRDDEPPARPTASTASKGAGSRDAAAPR